MNMRRYYIHVRLDGHATFYGSVGYRSWFRAHPLFLITFLGRNDLRTQDEYP